jgi:hypothetical protein
VERSALSFLPGDNSSTMELCASSSAKRPEIQRRGSTVVVVTAEAVGNGGLDPFSITPQAGQATLSRFLISSFFHSLSRSILR